MIITCGECQSRFNLDESRLRSSGSKVRCSECRAVFIAYPVAADAVREEMPMPAAPAADSVAAGQQLDAMIDSFFVGEGGAIQARPKREAQPEVALLEDFDLDLESVADEVIDSASNRMPAAVGIGPDMDLDLDLNFDQVGKAESGTEADMRFETLDLTRETSEQANFDLGEIEKLLDFESAPEPDMTAQNAARPSRNAAPPAGEIDDDRELDALFREAELSSTSEELDLKGLEEELDLQFDETPPSRPSAAAEPASAEEIDLKEIEKLLSSDNDRLGVEFDLLGAGQETDAVETAAKDTSAAAGDDDMADLDLSFDFEEDGDADRAAASQPSASSGGDLEIDLAEIDQMLGLDMPPPVPERSPKPEAVEEIDLDLDALLREADAPLATGVAPAMANEEDLAAGIESLMDEKVETPDTEIDEVLQFDFGDEVSPIAAADASESDLDLTPEPSVIAEEPTDYDVPEGTYRGEEPDDDLPEMALNLAEDGVSGKVEPTIKDFVESVSTAIPGVEPAAGDAGDIELEFQIEEESPAAGEKEKATTARLVESQVPDYTATYTASAFATEGESSGAAGAAAASMQTLVHPPPFPPRRKFPWALLWVPLLLLAIAFGVMIGLEWFGIQVPAVSQTLRENPYLRRLLPTETPDLGNLQIRTTGVNSRFLENRHLGRLFVITGMARNDYPAARSHIQLTAKLYLKGKVLSKTESAFAGNTIGDAELQGNDFNALRRSMKNRNGVRDSNLNVPPGKELPFMVVFNEIPENLEEYTLEVASSSPAK